MSNANPSDPHAGTEVLHSGEPLASARLLVLLLHGRDGDAARTLDMARLLPPEGVCFLAPAAAGNSWYPKRFLAPVDENEPWLTSALALVSRLVDQAIAAGVSRERVLVGGFSQGACLSLEWALRAGGRMGGVFALSGAVVGQPGSARPLDRDMAGTPVLLACGNADRHIPVASVKESATILKASGASVTERLYPGLGHIIVSDEFSRIGRMIRAASGAIH